MTEKAKPILFSGPMVQAILAGRKTMTRRVLKPAKGATIADCKPTGVKVGIAEIHALPLEKLSLPKYKVGDLLWVREAWRTESNDCDIWAPSKLGGGETILFEADANWKDNKSVGRLRASMHMPRWASRITLEVTAVKVERLKDISEDDARAEGCEPAAAHLPDVRGEGYPLHRVELWKEGFSELWESINGPGSWGANPWVAAYSFKVLE